MYVCSNHEAKRRFTDEKQSERSQFQQVVILVISLTEVCEVTEKIGL